MGATTEISWTDATFNPWWGCQRVSPGCEHCYAESFAHRYGHEVWGPESGGVSRRFFGDKHWNEPVRWNRDAEIAGVRKRVFCASMADVFEDRRDLDAPRERLWALILATPWLDWQLLTKRPENVPRLAPETWPVNAWLGVTAENQKYADLRVPLLLDVLGPEVYFVSYEPAIGPMVMRREWLSERGAHAMNAVSWVIVGGESGAGCRPFDPEWARETIRACREEGAAPFVKQFGGMAKGKGGDMDKWPADLRVREFPTRRDPA